MYEATCEIRPVKFRANSIIAYVLIENFAKTVLAEIVSGHFTVFYFVFFTLVFYIYQEEAYLSTETQNARNG